ncbi:hypothetical protein N7495_000360 [Penicillium taxi]|uniref:uncharacterized protein n=1 Tax=Penicillium taxi TaxID=168475 RepID=UPI00254591BD|nr:uncharacterized protein N7495_000360 [Penicillium taxi]KAJ5907678.1 hypothetical protein N7495_000360 [Penicillium taxi]
MTLRKWHNHWPGGIPFYICRRGEPVEDMATASRAWRFFVREQWVDGAAVNEQRRALIERWATADQKFRDSYESRAPEDERVFENPEDDSCLIGLSDTRIDPVHICIIQWAPETQALLAKCLITLFGWDGGYEYLAYQMSMYFPMEDNQGDILEIFKFRQSVARPDFLDIYMTVDGTILFSECEPKLIIDDRTLETGLCLWVQFQNNGTRERAWRVQMVIEEFPGLFLDAYPNMTPLDSVLVYMEDYQEDSDPEHILEDEPVDMRRPFVEIYPGDSQQLDQYAPGFREAEAGNGLAIGYDLERILADDGGPLKIIEE